jgi:hypothetical protein
MEVGAGTHRYEAIDDWLQLPDGFRWGQVVQVIVDSQDRLFYFHRQKPGVVMFDWWAKNNIFGVDFKAGVNNETDKYFIDYCADQGCPGAELTSYFFPPDADETYMLGVKRHAYLRGVNICGTAIGNTFTHPPGEARDKEQECGRPGQEQEQVAQPVAVRARPRLVLDEAQGGEREDRPSLGAQVEPERNPHGQAAEQEPGIEEAHRVFRGRAKTRRRAAAGSSSVRTTAWRRWRSRSTLRHSPRKDWKRLR